MKNIKFSNGKVDIDLRDYSKNDAVILLNLLLSNNTETVKHTEEERLSKIYNLKEDETLVPVRDIIGKDRIPNTSEHFRCPECLQSVIALSDNDELLIDYEDGIEKVLVDKETVDGIIEHIISNVTNNEKYKYRMLDDLIFDINNIKETEKSKIVNSQSFSLRCPVCGNKNTNELWIICYNNNVDNCNLCGGEIEENIKRSSDGTDTRSSTCLNNCTETETIK